MFLAFDLQTYDGLSSLGGLRNGKTVRGPDGVVAEFTFQFVKPGKGKAFLRGMIGLEMSTRVRSSVVGAWLQSIVGGVSRFLVLNGVNYSSDLGSLAKAIDDATCSLPAGTPSDPSTDDDGDGGGVGARRIPRPRDPKGENADPSNGTPA